MVGREVQLDSLGAERPLRDPHYSGAVDNDIDGGNIRPRENFGGCCSDGLLAPQVHLQGAILHIGIFSLQRVDALLNLSGSAAREDDAGGALGSLSYCQSTGVNLILRWYVRSPLPSRSQYPCGWHQ